MKWEKRRLNKRMAARVDNSIERLRYDRNVLLPGEKYVCGVDEVGRGPLAGPVTCCAVIMKLDDESMINGINDSKKLSEKKREELSKLILENAVAIKICSVDEKEIDRINILEATKRCMEDCINGLDVEPDVVLVDALKLNIPYRTTGIIGGDATSYSIGAASICAKVHRDALMREYAIKYPGYGFEKNKGYGTKDHIEAIKALGPCEIHRRTFIKNFI